MKYLLPSSLFVTLLFVFSFSASAQTPVLPSITPDIPIAPTIQTLKPVLPEMPDIPEPPEISGDYAIPQISHVRVRVIAHPLPVATLSNHRSPTPAVVLACTPDNQSTQTVSPAGWSLPNGIWTYRVNYATRPSGLPTLTAKTAIANSFATWDSLLTSIAFVEGSSASATRSRYDGQNAVLWRRLSGSSIAITYVWYNTVSHTAVETDLVFNSRYAWSYTSPNAGMCSWLNSYDVQNIGTHEVGHIVGLNDMYAGTDGDLTMYGYGEKGEMKKDTLTTGDQNSAILLYSTL